MARVTVQFNAPQCAVGSTPPEWNFQLFPVKEWDTETVHFRRYAGSQLLQRTSKTNSEPTTTADGIANSSRAVSMAGRLISKENTGKTVTVTSKNQLNHS